MCLDSITHMVSTAQPSVTWGPMSQMGPRGKKKNLLKKVNLHLLGDVFCTMDLWKTALVKQGGL